MLGYHGHSRRSCARLGPREGSGLPAPQGHSAARRSSSGNLERRSAMKLLVVNPNSSETVTAAIMASARRGATTGTELVGVTTKGGTRNIDCAFADYLSGAFMI